MLPDVGPLYSGDGSVSGCASLSPALPSTRPEAKRKELGHIHFQ